MGLTRGLCGIAGEQFDVGYEICGAVVSVRSNEDIISVWNKTADNKEAVEKIRYVQRLGVWGERDGRRYGPLKGKPNAHLSCLYWGTVLNAEIKFASLCAFRQSSRSSTSAIR